MNFWIFQDKPNKRIAGYPLKKALTALADALAKRPEGR
jgi:hypothetical protein